MADPEERREIAALVRELLVRLERDDLTELSVTRGDLRVRVRRDDRTGARFVATEAAGAAATGTPATLPGREPPAADGAASDVVEVRAPLTGVFFRSPSPQAAPFVQAGSTVAVGQIIGLIEAMKLFNEIRSTAAGRVRRVIVESGQLVRAHAPLLEVEPQ